MLFSGMVITDDLITRLTVCPKVHQQELQSFAALKLPTFLAFANLFISGVKREEACILSSLIQDDANGVLPTLRLFAQKSVPDPLRKTNVAPVTSI